MDIIVFFFVQPHFDAFKITLEVYNRIEGFSRDHSTFSVSQPTISRAISCEVPKMGVKLAFIALMACVVSSVNGQTFQYSRGWTNGKRSGLSPKETACELHRIRALLEGKPLNPYYWPCTFRQFPDPNGRIVETNADLTKIPVEVDDKK